jgi:anthranilate phosphoribosyltransferase
VRRAGGEAHGNRAASSKAGGADTLEALGVNLTIAPEVAEAQLNDLGICFLFAQNHHPGLKRLGPIRKALGKRTIFNLLGPLANPAGVKRQLLGIARPDYVPVYAQALRLLGTERGNDRIWRRGAGRAFHRRDQPVRVDRLRSGS